MSLGSLTAGSDASGNSKALLPIVLRRQKKQNAFASKYLVYICVSFYIAATSMSSYYGAISRLRTIYTRNSLFYCYYCHAAIIIPGRYHQMAGRSGRAGVSRGQEGGKTAEGVDTACGESFLIIPVSAGFSF